MGFLDNSGDIILDAVLTDEGRKRLSRGDGSFKIQKFALGDDEIDYAIYDKDHASGSAYYDLQLLQTPILEAFTNSATSMKSKLVTYTKNNLLYLPILLWQTTGTSKKGKISTNNFVDVLVDSTTLAAQKPNTVLAESGLINGSNSQKAGGAHVVVEQGLYTTQRTVDDHLERELIESQYIVEVDHRLLRVVDSKNKVAAGTRFVDDTEIATYVFDRDDDTKYVSIGTTFDKTRYGNSAGGSSNKETEMTGPLGTVIELDFEAQDALKTGTYYFDKFGTSGKSPGNLGLSSALNGTTYYVIHTNVKITGGTTGYSIEIPIRLLKKQA